MLKLGCRAAHSCKLTRIAKFRRRIVPLVAFLPHINGVNKADIDARCKQLSVVLRQFVVVSCVR
jgi:hypothetical protein